MRRRQDPEERRGGGRKQGDGWVMGEGREERKVVWRRDKSIKNYIYFSVDQIEG